MVLFSRASAVVLQSGEHAIGHAKKQYLVESVGETAFGLMQAIKQVFDPKGILNPGKVCTNVEEG